MANPFLQVVNPGNCAEARLLTATAKPATSKTALDVNICNADEIAGGAGSAELCVQSFDNQEILASVLETQINLAVDAKSYVKITNMSEFSPIFFSQSAGGDRDVILPCAVMTVCMNTLINNSLFFVTESGEARVIISQAQS